MTHVGVRDWQDRPTRTRVSGIETYGRVTRDEMIQRFREHYDRQLRQAREALALTDDELIVTTYLGSYAQRGKTEVTE